jgi:hypothetical protein
VTRPARLGIPWLSLVLLAFSGCQSATARDTPPKAAAARAASSQAVALPPSHGRFSYQIGGAYTPAAGVTIVDRDRTDPPYPGAYSICYVNAYQAQAEAVGWWKSQHPELLLRDAAGHLVIDREWGEPLLDVSTATRRAGLLAVIGGWVDGCAARGHRAVEADNLDSYTRSRGLLTAAHTLAFARLLAGRAHADHLAIAQKNAAELSARVRGAGFDFAIAEECQVYSECGAYTAAYGAGLIEIEYTDQPASAFRTACQLRGKTASVVLRDRDVTPPGNPRHVERWCP